MSGRNGDRSRFHVTRKRRVAQRKRNRELIAGIASRAKTTTASSASKPKAPSA